MDVVDAGQAKVGQFDLAGGGDEDVLRLQVAVDDAVRVQEVDAAQDLEHEVLDLVGGQAGRRTPFQVHGQVLVHVLEHHVQHQLLLVFQTRSVANVQQSVPEGKTMQRRSSVSTGTRSHCSALASTVESGLIIQP